MQLLKAHGRILVILLTHVGLAAIPHSSIAQPTTAGATPRVEIALFRYRGAADGQDSGQKFDVFRGLVEQKIDNLRNQVLPDRESEGTDLAYIADVHLKFRGEDTFERSRDVVQWLENEGKVLNAMRGVINSDDGTNFYVFSRFYLTDPSDYLTLDVVSVDLPVKSSEFANTRDTHTLVILYALAMDARRTGHSPAQIAMFLSAASNVIADLDRRSGPLTGDLAQIKAAVERAKSDILGYSDASTHSP